MRNRLAPAANRSAGFTLIELMIAVAIVALLAAVTLPSFLDSLRKSKRTEAFSAISAVQQAQERWRSNRPTYSDNLTAAVDADPPGLGLSSSTSGGLYTISLSGVGPAGYTVSAVAVAGKSQVNDGDCARLAARVEGGRITYAGCASCDSFTFTETHACWRR
jgi:type IV pilus assembly protein PilE